MSLMIHSFLILLSLRYISVLYVIHSIVPFLPSDDALNDTFCICFHITCTFQNYNFIFYTTI